MSEEHLESIRLSISHRFPSEPTRAKRHCIFFHNLSLSSSSLRSLGDSFFDKSDDSILTFIDLPGHGKSPGTRFHFESYDELVTEVLSSVNSVIKENQITEVPVVFIGDGVGMTISLELVQSYDDQVLAPIHGIVGLNPTLHLSGTTLISMLSKLPESISGHMRIPFIDQGDSGDPLSGGPITMRTWSVVKELIARVKYGAYYLETPSLFLYNDDLPKRGQLYYKSRMKKLVSVKSVDRKRDNLSEIIYNWVLQNL